MFFERLDVDPRHLRQRVEIGEVAVVGPVFDDGVGVGGLDVGDEGEILGGAAVHVDFAVVPQQVVDQGLVVVVGDLRAQLGHLLEDLFPLRPRPPRRDDPVGRMTLRADGRERLRSLVRGRILQAGAGRHAVAVVGERHDGRDSDRRDRALRRPGAQIS